MRPRARGHRNLGPPTGRRHVLRLGQAVKATLMYLKNNLTQEVIAELLEVSQPTISRTIAQLETVIADILDHVVPDLASAAAGRVTIIDGTLTPCWSWREHPELRSGKHHTTGHNHQVVVDTTGALLHLCDPLPGARHDRRAVSEHRLDDVLDPTNTIADKGCLGTGFHTPLRKPPGGQLLTSQNQFNADINAIRYVVERAIAHLKTWRILHTDYRRPLSTYQNAFETVRALHCFKISGELSITLIVSKM